MDNLQRSWQRFLTGLLIFAISAAVLVLGSHIHPVIYWLSISCLLAGFALAMAGYWRIFLRRFNAFKDIKPPRDRHDD